MGPRELLHRKVTVALPKRRDGVTVGVDRRRSCVVQRRQPIGAQLLDSDRLTRDELVSGRLLPDLGQRVAGLLLGGETAAHLLALPGLWVLTGADCNLAAHNGFPGRRSVMVTLRICGGRCCLSHRTHPSLRRPNICTSLLKGSSRLPISNWRPTSLRALSFGVRVWTRWPRCRCGGRPSVESLRAHRPRSRRRVRPPAMSRAATR